MSISAIRLLVFFNGDYLKVCKIVLSNNDASLYIFPYGVIGDFYSGKRFFDNDEETIEGKFTYKDTFSYLKDINSEKTPKLSIHQTGRVHVHIGRKRIGPMRIGSVQDLRDEHIASVSVTRFDGLPVHKSELKHEGKERDYVFRGENGVDSCRFIISVNGFENVFRDVQNIVITMGNLDKVNLDRPVYYGIRSKAQQILDTDLNQSPSVLVISGWNPVEMDSGKSSEYLYIVAL